MIRQVVEQGVEDSPPARKVGRYLRYESAEVRSWLESLDDHAA